MVALVASTTSRGAGARPRNSSMRGRRSASGRSLRVAVVGPGPYTIDTVLQKMEQHRIRRIPVIDNDRIVGMISESDLSKGHREGGRLTDQQIIEKATQAMITRPI